MRKLLSLVALTSLAVNAWAGTITGQVQNAAAGPVRNGTFSFTLTAPATVAGTATVVTSSVPCYTDGNGNVSGEPDPLLAPSLSVNLASGTLPAGTYFVKIWYFDTTGNSFVSPEASATLTSQGTLNVLSPVKEPLNASGFRVGISTASGTETLQGSVAGVPGTWGNFNQSVPLVVGSAAPASNTTVCTLRFNDELTPSFTCYDVGLTSSTGANIPGYPAYWYLNGGSAGNINVGSGTPQSNVCQGQGVVYPQAIISQPPFNATQTINGGLIITGSLFVGGYDNIIFADQQAGADACAKITTSFSKLPSTGGIIDATGFQGNQTCTAGVTFPASKPITLKLGAAALITGANTAITVPASGVVCIKGMGPSLNGSGTTSAISSTAATAIEWDGSEGCLEDVEIFNTTGNGITLTGSGTNSVSHNHFKHLHILSAGVINAGKIGLRLVANSATALVTENTFESIIIDDFDISESLETSGAQGPTDNYHFGWTYSGFAGAGTAGIKITSGDVNTWVAGFTSTRSTGVRLTGGSYNMFLGNRFESGGTDVNDGGTGTMFTGNSFSNCSTSTFATTALLLGSNGNTTCSADLMPRGLTVGGASTLGGGGKFAGVWNKKNAADTYILQLEDSDAGLIRVLGFNVEQQLQRTGTASDLSFGNVTELWTPTTDSAIYTGQETALYGSYSHFGSGALTAGVGVEGEAFNAGPATATLLVGAEGTANCGGTVAGMPNVQTPTNNGNCTNVRAVEGAVHNFSSGAITNGVGVFVDTPTNTGGGSYTNTYGVFVNDQNIGTNKWAIKTGLGKVEFGDVVAMDSTASVASTFAVGTTPITSVGVLANNSALATTSQIEMLSAPACTSAATVQCEGIRSRFDTAAASFTITTGSAIHIVDGIKGAGSTITTENGLLIDTLANGSTNFAIQTGANPVKLGGSLNFTNVLLSPTAPSIAGAGCGGSGATIATNNGTAAFSVNVGSTPTTACTITLPTATNAWNCFATDITTNSTSVFLQKQTATGASSVTITNFSDVAVASNFTASDILQVSCFAR
jgi:hypothetical protein